jgi:hypothetical protein
VLIAADVGELALIGVDVTDMIEHGGETRGPSSPRKWAVRFVFVCICIVAWRDSCPNISTRVSQEVILSAGTYLCASIAPFTEVLSTSTALQTSQLLELSGIGNKKNPPP